MEREYREARKGFLRGDEQCPDCGSDLADGCAHATRKRAKAAAEVTEENTCRCGRLRAGHPARRTEECD